MEHYASLLESDHHQPLACAYTHAWNLTTWHLPLQIITYLVVNGLINFIYVDIVQNYPMKCRNMCSINDDIVQEHLISIVMSNLSDI